MNDEVAHYFSNLGHKTSISQQGQQQLKQTEYYQRFKIPRGRVEMPVFTRKNNCFQCDTMFYPLRGRDRCLFCAIEMTSRWGFIKAYKHDKPTGSEVVEMLIALKEQHEIQYLCCDPGSEFNNNAVRKFCAESNIEIYYYDTHDLNAKSIVERFNRTVRSYLNRYVHTISPNWLAKTSLLSEAYNAHPNRNIGTTPNHADTSLSTQNQIRENAYNKGLPYLSKLSEFRPGIRVRVAEAVNPELPVNELIKASTFRKEGAIWSSKIYTVRRIDGYKVVLEGSERRYSPRDLQIIKGEVLKHPINDTLVPDKSRIRRKKGEHELQTLNAVYDESVLNSARKTRSQGSPETNYEIEKILGHFKRNGKYLFTVKWKGYADRYNTEEPLKNLVLNGIPNEMLLRYLEQHPLLQKKLGF
jgi:hypothetical protein